MCIISIYMLFIKIDLIHVHFRNYVYLVHNLSIEWNDDKKRINFIYRLRLMSEHHNSYKSIPSFLQAVHHKYLEMISKKFLSFFPRMIKNSFRSCRVYVFFSGNEEREVIIFGFEINQVSTDNAPTQKL